MNKSQPYKPKTSFIDKSFVPEQIQNDELIKKTFLFFSEGNFLKIRDHLLSNHLTLNIENEDGECVLHTIIKNGTITDNEKVELTKFCVAKGEVKFPEPTCSLNLRVFKPNLFPAIF